MSVYVVRVSFGILVFQEYQSGAMEAQIFPAMEKYVQWAH